MGEFLQYAEDVYQEAIEQENIDLELSQILDSGSDSYEEISST